MASVAEGVSSLAARRPARGRVRAIATSVPATVLLLMGMVALSLWLRTRALRAGFWIDEGLSVGIASYPLAEIPGVLRQDGSPPLYYAILHGWIAVVGPGEAATHGLSVGFALLIIPVAFWAARSLAGPRAGWIAAVLAACHPFLTYNAQETRMYALMALLGLLVAATFAHAFVLRDRRYLAPFAVVATLAVYTHNWALFLVAGTLAALVVAWQASGERRALVRDAALAYGAVGALYLPWVPTLLFQAAHTGAPWSSRPGWEGLLEAVLVAAGSNAGAPLFVVVAGAGVAALLRPRPSGAATSPAGPEADARRRVAAALLALIGVSVLLAWLSSQVAPAWASRYMAVFVGPVLLLGSIGLAHARRLGIVVVAILVFFWWTPREGALSTKSNVRDVAARISERPVGAGDLVVSTHPEQLPVLRYYLRGEGFRFADSMGRVADPRVMDWRDVHARLRAAGPRRTARPLVDALAPGQAVILVQPILRTYGWRAPYTALVKRRSVQWERALERDDRLRRVDAFPRFGLGTPPRGVRAVVYRVQGG